jgi:hypothetical protein
MPGKLGKLGKLARDMVKEKNLDLQYDKIFVKNLVKGIQKLSPDIGAYIFPETKMVVFWMDTVMGNVIIYKVLLDKNNVNDITPEEHIKKVETIVRLLKLNMIPLKELNQAAREVKRTNFKLGRLL